MFKKLFFYIILITTLQAESRHSAFFIGAGIGNVMGDNLVSRDFSGRSDKLDLGGKAGSAEAIMGIGKQLDYVRLSLEASYTGYTFSKNWRAKILNTDWGYTLKYKDSIGLFIVPSVVYNKRIAFFNKTHCYLKLGAMYTKFNVKLTLHDAVAPLPNTTVQTRKSKIGPAIAIGTESPIISNGSLNKKASIGFEYLYTKYPKISLFNSTYNLRYTTRASFSIFKLNFKTYFPL